jgi:hypothetical protein
MKKILFINYGGLGDHLQFTTLPEAFHQLGYETYISSRSHFRSKETWDLVWRDNPYIRGVSDEEPNCGHIGPFDLCHKEYSMNRNWELMFGATDVTTENDSRYPVIYYQPKNMPLYNDSLIIDLNGFSQPNIYNFEVIQDKVNNIIKENKFKNIFNIMPSQANYSKQTNKIEISGVKNVTSRDIFVYADMIYSCKRFVSIWSGGSQLDSAIKGKYNSKLDIDCFSDNTDHSFYNYDNVNYVRGAMVGNLYK